MGIRSVPLALLALALLPASASATPTTQIIVKREPGLSGADRADIRADADVRFVRDLSLPRTEVVTAPAAQTREALQELRADHDVAYAEIDHRRWASAADPLMPFLWALNNTGQPIRELEGVDDADSDVVEAWELLADPPGGGQTVAVVDSGIDADHEDLAARVGVQHNFVGTNGPGADDEFRHGTHVSGTIAATRDNGVGIAGVAPAATLMALRALDHEGAGYDSDIAEAFVFAGGHGVRVVNASFSGPAGGETLRTAIAAYPNTLFVVAAGNGGTDGVGDSNDSAPQYPCNIAERNVLCVGASTNQDLRAAFSNFGAATVDVFAPGQGIASTIPYLAPSDIKYVLSDGTSMATPHVAAAAALVLQAEPTLSTGDVKGILLASVDAGAAFAGRSLSGGRLNAREAVELAQAAATLPDGDGDGFPDAADACVTSAASTSADGCPDADEDAVPDSVDNCPSAFNPGQQNSDGRTDGGDACDQDYDNDDRPNTADACPTLYAVTANGCPAQPPPPPPPADRDGDGRIDVADACPDEPAATPNGCPIAQIAAVSPRVKNRSATVTVSTSRAATVKILVQRKKGRSWVRVTSRTRSTVGNRVSLTAKRLKRGLHRVKVSISSSGGAGAPRTRSFRVR